MFIQSLKNLFTRPRELSAQEYYKSRLLPDDALALSDFTKYLGDSLISYLLPSAIIAVGSSTYDDAHWQRRKKLNLKDPSLKAAETYSDLDIVVCPIQSMELDTLCDVVSQILMDAKMPFKKHEDSTAGVSYCNATAISDDGKSESILSPFAHFDYGRHSLTTRLPHGRSLDILLGHEDEPLLSADDKIAVERKNNYAFSLIYSPNQTPFVHRHQLPRV
ncbi:MAG TPA: hypothetical protein VK158_05275 [Acidobacteriota bacterium]|nr:hypothetical protein [Acidobacteriota bacterium]